MPQHVPEEEPVLLVDRQVEMELVGDVSHDRRLRGLPGGELSGTRRDDEEDDVGEYRGDQEQEEGPEEPPDDVGRHGPIVARSAPG